MVQKVPINLHQFSCFPAILITTMLEDLNTQEKDTVTFEVNVNYEGITYKWLKNGVEIRSTDRCQARCKELTHTLSVRNVHFGDSAEYTFMAGSAVTTAKLYVEGKIVLMDTWNHYHYQQFTLQLLSDSYKTPTAS